MSISPILSHVKRNFAINPNGTYTYAKEINIMRIVAYFTPVSHVFAKDNTQRDLLQITAPRAAVKSFSCTALAHTVKRVQ